MRSAWHAGMTILCFHYEAISPNTVLVPSRRLRVQRDAEHTWLQQEADELAQVQPCLLLLAQSFSSAQLVPAVVVAHAEMWQNCFLLRRGGVLKISGPGLTL